MTFISFKGYPKRAEDDVMPGTKLLDLDDWSAEELLRRIIDVYNKALDALETQETSLLGELLSDRRLLLAQVKRRDAEGWRNSDQRALQPLIERVKRAEKQFIDRLDARVTSMRHQMVESNHAKRGVATYQRQASPQRL